MHWLKETPRVYARRIKSIKTTQEFVECWLPIALKPKGYLLMAKGLIPTVDCNWDPEEDDSHLLLVNIRADLLARSDYLKPKAIVTATKTELDYFQPEKLIPGVKENPVKKIFINEPADRMAGGFVLDFNNTAISVNNGSDDRLDLLVNELLNGEHCALVWDYDLKNEENNYIPKLRVASAKTLLWG